MTATPTLLRPIGAAWLLVAVIAAHGAAQVVVPRGYRLPSHADISGGWQTHRVEFPDPFSARVDLNGDGRDDEVRLFMSVKGQGWALFAFVARGNGRHHAWQLAGDLAGGAQAFAVRVAAPGRFETTCGRGHLDCPHPEPEVLNLTLPSLEFVEFGRTRSVFWWDATSRSFKRTWLND